jgi:hypothetical protein
MAVFNPVLCSSALVVAQPRARKRKKIRIEILIGFTDVLRVRSKRSRDLRAYAQIAYLTNPSWSRMRLLRSSSVASCYSSHGRSQRFAANVDDLRSRRFCPSSRFAIFRRVETRNGCGGWVAASKSLVSARPIATGDDASGDCARRRGDEAETPGPHHAGRRPHRQVLEARPPRAHAPPAAAARPRPHRRRARLPAVDRVGANCASILISDRYEQVSRVVTESRVLPGLPFSALLRCSPSAASDKTVLNRNASFFFCGVGIG